MAKGKRPLVLLVEPDAAKRASTIARLRAAGCDVAEAWNRADCLGRVETLHPDAVLIGAATAAEDGLSLCRELRNRASARQTPIIVVVPSGDREAALMAQGAGASETISEPLELGLLGDRIHALVFGQGLSRRTAQSGQASGLAEQVARLGYWELDLTTKRFACSAACQAILGLPPGQTMRSLEEFIGRVPAPEQDAMMEWLHTVIHSGEPDYLSHAVVAPDGTEKFVLEHAEPLKAESGATVRLRGTVQDVTKMHSGKTSVWRLAYYDALTDLPNRRAFEEKLRQEFSGPRPKQGRFALLFLDIDDFKAINDQHGHRIGDQVLKAVAKRISQVVRDSDVIGRNTAQDLPRVARLGGDEFTVLLSQLNEPEDAGEVARRLITSINRPILIERQEFHVSTSVGIAICPDHGTEPERLVEHADRAMYAAKQAGKNRFCYSDSGPRPQAREPRAEPETPDRRAPTASARAAETTPGVEQPAPQEVLRLRAQIRRLQQEREILMRAANLIAKEFSQEFPPKPAKT